MSTRTIKTEVRAADRNVAASRGPQSEVKISVKQLSFLYGKSQALHEVSLAIPERIVMAFIGPSGCGKSTFLRTLNRMNDVIPGTRVSGEVLIDDRDIYAPGTDVVDLRRKVGWFFKNQIPFPNQSLITWLTA